MLASAYGYFALSTIVEASGAEVLSSHGQSIFKAESAPKANRSKEYLTSSEVMALPLWNFAGRSLTVNVSLSGETSGRACSRFGCTPKSIPLLPWIPLMYSYRPSCVRPAIWCTPALRTFTRLRPAPGSPYAFQISLPPRLPWVAESSLLLRSTLPPPDAPTSLLVPPPELLLLPPQAARNAAPSAAVPVAAIA